MRSPIRWWRELRYTRDDILNDRPTARDYRRIAELNSTIAMFEEEGMADEWYLDQLRAERDRLQGKEY